MRVAANAYVSDSECELHDLECVLIIGKILDAWLYIYGKFSIYLYCNFINIDL